jgi:hypothetical protein
MPCLRDHILALLIENDAEIGATTDKIGFETNRHRKRIQRNIVTAQSPRGRSN